MLQMSLFDAPVAPDPVKSEAAGTPPSGAPATVSQADYIITDDPIGAGGAMFKARTNLRIIELFRQIKSEFRLATPLEQKLLVLYSGWGHTSQPFHPQPKGKWAVLQQEMRSHFTDEEWRAAAFSTINAHYTSPEVIRFIWQVVQRLGFSGGKVLEPALGIGHFFGLMPAEIRAKSKLYGCELDIISARLAQLLYPSAEIIHNAFEMSLYQDDFFDLSITNVPFANVAVRDLQLYTAERKHLAAVGLHNYYFLKTLTKTRPGGLIAFITSRYTMDSLESGFREYLASQANLLGAVRLPVTAFKKNAHTEVTTDIIFLMKKDPTRPGALSHDFTETFEQSVSPQDRGTSWRINQFYLHQPFGLVGQMQIAGGRYKDQVECVLSPDTDLAGALEARLNLFPKGIYKPAVIAPRQQTVLETEKFEDAPGYPWLREGSYAEDAWYRIWQMGKWKNWKRAKIDGKQLSRVRGMVEVRDAFYKTVLANIEFFDDVDLLKAQQELQTVYRRFVSKFGYLHETANINAFTEDADADNILALERWDAEAGRAERAAIFTTRLLRPETRPVHAENAMDALIISLREQQQIDMARLIELTDSSPKEIVEELSGKIYFDPALGNWVTADEYLSGNVRKKLSQAEAENLDVNVLALREVLPLDVPAADIFVQLGAPWVPVEMIEEFIARRIYDDPYHNDGVIKVAYLKTMGFYRLDVSGMKRLVFSAENKSTWGTARINASELIEKCLNGQKATIIDVITETDGSTKKVVNQEATLVARAKQTEIKAAFVKWLWASPDRCSRLETIYNERFNSIVPRAYDGTHLVFPGLNPLIILRQIQKDVIWRGLQQHSLMIAHGVGFGKTLSQMCLGMRLKQLGLRQRIMLVVKRATFGQFLAAIREAYPLARLQPVQSGQTGAQRRHQMARIVTDDFDLIVTTHPIFGKIPLKPETIRHFMNEQMGEIEEAILEVDDDISTKELEKAKKRLQNRIDKMLGASSQAHDAQALYFEDLGIDTLIVDESGAYKNLFFHSTLTRISGVGGSESGRAYDMKLKIRTLQAKKGTIIFASGTPLENSISEVFSMMSFLMPDELKEIGMHHFDAWAQTFGQVVTSVEMKPDGSGFRMAERFAAFHNLPQLKKLWFRVADTQMDGDVAGVVRPDIATGKAIGIQAEPYPELKQIIETLANRAANLAEVDPADDNMLVIINHADKASLDARLLGKFPVVNDLGQRTGEYIEITHDYLGSKVNLMVAQVLKIYDDTRGVELPGQSGKHNLAQLIFLDSSTPVKKMGAPTVRLPEFNERGIKTGYIEVQDPDNKIAFTVYEDIYLKLVAGGMPPSEIAFAQEYSDDRRKSKLAALINAGKIAVAIGHTEIMGIGLNCQRLLVAIHHLDCPWKPAWIEQREGRIWRHGNLCPLISIYSYVMAGSFDVYRWQTLERKARFIEAFNSPDLTMLFVEDPGAAVMSAKEMVALATGNDSIIRQVELQTRLRILNAQYNEHRNSHYSAESRIARLTDENKREQILIDQRAVTLARVKEEGIAAAQAFGEGLYALCEPHFEVYDEQVLVGELYGISVLYSGHVKYEIGEGVARKRGGGVDTNYWGASEKDALEKAPVDPEAEVVQEVEPEPPPPPRKIVSHNFHLENPELKFSSPNHVLRVLDDARDALHAATLVSVFGEHMPSRQQMSLNYVADNNNRIAESKRQLQIQFSGEEEMDQLRAELFMIEAEIKATLGDVDVEELQAGRVDMDTGQDAAPELEVSEDELEELELA